MLSGHGARRSWLATAQQLPSRRNTSPASQSADGTFGPTGSQDVGQAGLARGAAAARGPERRCEARPGPHERGAARGSGRARPSPGACVGRRDDGPLPRCHGADASWRAMAPDRLVRPASRASARSCVRTAPIRTRPCSPSAQRGSTAASSSRRRRAAACSRSTSHAEGSLRDALAGAVRRTIPQVRPRRRRRGGSSASCSRGSRTSGRIAPTPHQDHADGRRHGIQGLDGLRLPAGTPPAALTDPRQQARARRRPLRGGGTWSIPARVSGAAATEAGLVPCDENEAGLLALARRRLCYRRPGARTRWPRWSRLQLAAWTQDAPDRTSWVSPCRAGAWSCSRLRHAARPRPLGLAGVLAA